MPFQTNTSTTPAGSRLLANYNPVEGVPDELMRPDGLLRAVWSKLIPALEDINPEDMAKRIARGEQYLRDAGVFYRRYGPQDSSERDWPLSAMPVLIDEDEWSNIATGLTQRAELDRHGIRGAGIASHPNAGELAEITRLIEEKRIRPIVSQVQPLSEAPPRTNRLRRTTRGGKWS